MKNSKFFLFLLLVSIASSTVSCGETAEPSKDTNTAATDTVAAAAETTSYLDSLPVGDLSGYTFHVIGQSTSERQNFYTEEKDGDVINIDIRSAIFLFVFQ